MLGHTTGAGYDVVGDPEQANVIVVNTCGFIGEAKQESIDAILEMARFKEAGSCERLVVAGCLPQRYAKELSDEMPEVDHFIGTDEVAQVVDAIAGRIERVHVAETPRFLYDDLAPAAALDGAAHRLRENRRGLRSPLRVLHHPQAARPAAQPHAWPRWCAKPRTSPPSGAKELCLVAQDLTTYGRDLPDGRDDDGPTLERLLAALAQVGGVRWLRLHYAYPTAVTDGLLAVMAREASVAKYLDVPIQHVDDAVLKSMRRGHGSRQVYDLVERVRKYVPGVTIRSTFIVGHPGETEQSFAKLCDFVRSAELDRVGVFNYSLEEGTTAALLPHRVPPKEIEARRRELLRIQRQISKKKMKAMRGREIEVLVEGSSDESEYVLMGRHEGQAPEIDGQVYLTLGPDFTPAVGTLVRAKVTGSAEYDLAAEVLGPASPLSAPPVRTGAPRISLPIAR